MNEYLRLVREQETLISAHAPSALNEARQRAAQRLEKLPPLGIRREERYKYVDLQGLLAPDYGLNFSRIRPKVVPERDFRCNIPAMGADAVYVVNDIPFLGESARRRVASAGGLLCTFAEAATLCPEVLASHYDSLCANPTPVGLKPHGGERTGLLQTLLCQDGVLLHLPKGVQMAEALQIVVLTTSQMPILATPRLLVVAEEASRVTLVLCDHTRYGTQPAAEAVYAPSDGGEGKAEAYRALSLATCECVLAPRARVDIYGVEETEETHARIGHFFVRQGEESHFSLLQTTLSCGMTRTQCDVRMTGPDAVCTLRGAVVASRAQRVDQNLLVAHEAPRCTSQMLFKHVLDGESQVSWAGNTLVQAGADGTEASQTAANLCISPQSRAFSQPMLEIYADDVHCTHGTTVGRLDEGALFYMRQRGIDEAEARLLLQHAFIAEVLGHVEVEALRARLSALVDQRFRGGASSCSHCAMACGKER